MIGLSLSSVSNHNMWYYDWVIVVVLLLAIVLSVLLLAIVLSVLLLAIVLSLLLLAIVLSLLLLAIVLSVLRFADPDYPFGVFKLFLSNNL
jgi:hypothetical protein